MTLQPAAEQGLARFLTLQAAARRAADCAELGYVMVNDAQPLFGYRHAALLIEGRVRALTGVSVVEPHAPFVAFVEQAAAQLQPTAEQQALAVEPANLQAQTRADWQALSPPAVLWLPLRERGGRPFGGLWLAREQPWTASESTLLGELAACYAHAWLALQPRQSWRLRWPRKKLLGLGAVIVLLMLLPVRQSVLAPAEVVPLQGQLVAAPLDGVIAEFLVRPNDAVQRGDVLLRFDATAFRAKADVAEHSLAVAEAELKANAQRAFSDADSGARIDLFAARVEQKRAERDYARELLARTEVRAERDGIAVFADAQQWIGRPVQTGERLLEIADPAQAELRIELAVADALDFQTGSPVALFLDSDPLQRRQASLQRIAYEARQTPSGQLAYRLDARFDGDAPRIGLRGTAKLHGERAPLLLYLLRRPLAALRQTLGL